MSFQFEFLSLRQRLRFRVGPLPNTFCRGCVCPALGTPRGTHTRGAKCLPKKTRIYDLALQSSESTWFGLRPMAVLCEVRGLGSHRLEVGQFDVEAALCRHWPR